MTTADLQCNPPLPPELGAFDRRPLERAGGGPALRAAPGRPLRLALPHARATQLLRRPPGWQFNCKKWIQTLLQKRIQNPLDLLWTVLSAWMQGLGKIELHDSSGGKFLKFYSQGI